MGVEYPKTGEFFSLVLEWSRPLMDHPAFRELAGTKVGWALNWDDDLSKDSNSVREVLMPEWLSAQHRVIIQFFNLWVAIERLKQVEFYFRRFPFKKHQVGRHDHLENICSMFFFSFYVLEERIRAYLTALNAVPSSRHINVGKALKLYRKWFREELRQRHEVTHVEPFDDVTIMSVMLHGLMENDLAHKFDHAKFAYRKASREWAARAKLKSERVSEFFELISAASLEAAVFLRVPLVLSADELKTR